MKHWLFLTLLLLIGCEDSTKISSPPVGALFEASNHHNVEVITSVCESINGRTENCVDVKRIQGVAGFEAPFDLNQNALRFRVPIEPSWQGTVSVQRGSFSDPRLLARKLPYTRLKPDEKAYVDLEFIPCESADEKGSCMDFSKYENLIDYSGVYEFRVVNGKVPPRGASILIKFSFIDEHIKAEIRLFDEKNNELIKGATRDKRCKSFRCYSPVMKVLTTPRALSFYTVREKDNEFYLVKSYRAIDSTNHETPSNTGKFSMTKKGFTYNTYYLDDVGRKKVTSTFRR